MTNVEAAIVSVLVLWLSRAMRVKLRKLPKVLVIQLTVVVGYDGRPEMPKHNEVKSRAVQKKKPTVKGNVGGNT